MAQIMLPTGSAQRASIRTTAVVRLPASSDSSLRSSLLDSRAFLGPSCANAQGFLLRTGAPRYLAASPDSARQLHTACTAVALPAPSGSETQPASSEQPPSPVPEASTSAAPAPATPASQLRPVEAIPAEALEAGGLKVSELGAEKRAELERLLMRHYMTVDLGHSGLRVLNFDPPIFTVDNFLPDARCQELIAAAEASGMLQASKIGAGNVSSSSGTTYNARRTSCSLLADNKVLEVHPRIERVVSDIQSRGRTLLQAKKWRKWGKPGFMPAAGQYTYESCQVARYERGQHFLAHEDAFPRGLARANGFQRSATLLLYLNDVPAGGRTRFDGLGIAVQPKRGKLLVFFPAQADGTADSRTLHTAEDAEGDHTKYVMQQWVACGFGAMPDAAAKAQDEEEMAKAAADGSAAAAPEAAVVAAAASVKGGKVKKAAGGGKKKK